MQGSFAAHDSIDAILRSSRNRQTDDERTLQTQFFSRLGFVSSELKELEFATRREIIETGIRIGNPDALCIYEADMSLQALTQEIGEELMELANIARRDFSRIPNEFVHPYIERSEHMSKGFLSDVMTSLSSGNAVTDASAIIQELEAQQEASSDHLSTIQEEIESEMAYMRRQMNYVKSEVFPMLQYSISYYRSGTEAIFASLSACN